MLLIQQNKKAKLTQRLLPFHIENVQKLQNLSIGVL